MKKHGGGKLLRPKDISTRLQRKLHNKSLKVIEQYMSAIITIIFFRDIHNMSDHHLHCGSDDDIHKWEQ
jgi:hypothetical protein